MSEKARTLIGLVLVAIGVFYNQISNFIITPEPRPNVVVIQIDQPSQEIISVAGPIANLVTDQHDRLKLCYFNKIFADRVANYSDVKAQQVNDIYVHAGKTCFNTSLKDKYNGFSVGLESLFKKGMGTQQHVLSDKEKAKVNKIFLGFAWCLNN